MKLKPKLLNLHHQLFKRLRRLRIQKKFHYKPKLYTLNHPKMFAKIISLVMILHLFPVQIFLLLISKTVSKKFNPKKGKKLCKKKLFPKNNHNLNQYKNKAKKRNQLSQFWILQSQFFLFNHRHRSNKYKHQLF